jgi:O-antigen biosynthesis protein
MNDKTKGLVFLKTYGLYAFIRRLITYLRNKEYQRKNITSFSGDIPNTESMKKYYFSEMQFFLNHISYKELVGCPEKRTITWIIPSFNKGSGGHNTIFRFARYFELCGYKNIFLIRNTDDNHDRKLRDGKGLKKTLLTHFSSMENVEVILYKNNADLLNHANSIKGDILIGTCWTSQLIAQNLEKFNKRFFFTQDKEDLFQASGAESLFINSLALNNKNVFISASKWLSTFPENKKSIYFDLGVDSLMSKNILNFSNANKDGRYKIAFYSRFSSPRRAVDLGWSYFEKLKDLGVDFEIHAFGQDIGNTKFDFPVVNHGVLSSYAMYSLIGSSDLSVALSTTNYSLLPLEAASLGVISCDVDTESNRMNYKGSPVILLSPYVDIGASQIKKALSSSRSTDTMRQAESVQQDFNWIKQFKKISIDVLNNSPHINKKVSVCIPTLNGGKKYIALLESLKAQIFVNIELHIIDSGSTDDTISNTLKFFKNADICKIDKSEFGHGKTRNMLAHRAKQNQVVFLTQDALLMSEILLITLVKHCQKPKIFGSFCRHIAYPNHNPFLSEELINHFDNLGEILSLSDFAMDEHHAKKIKFFSSNCCAINRDLLIKYPYDDVNYGEDQLWSLKMLNKGYGKAYVNDLCIMHSHEYSNDDELYNISKTDAEYNLIHFGNGLFSSLESMNKYSKNIAMKNFVSQKELNTQLHKNRIKFKAMTDAKKSKVVSY